MANLTLSIEDDLLRQARIRALELGTTVNAVVRNYLQTFAGPDQARRTLDEIVEIAEHSHASSGSQGRTWTREDVYER